MKETAYIGHSSQLCCVEEVRLIGGKGDGMRVHMCVYVCIRHARSPLGRERSLQLRKLVSYRAYVLGL